MLQRGNRDIKEISTQGKSKSEERARKKKKSLKVAVSEEILNSLSPSLSASIFID